MKKIKICYCLLVVSLFYSCVENDPAVSSTNLSLENVYGLREFPSVYEYEKALNLKELKELPGFVSLAEVVSNQKNTTSEAGRIWKEDEWLSEFTDAFLLEIIDSYGMVKIENYLIKLDFKKRRALVTKNMNRLISFRNELYEFDDVTAFGFEDDVLEILFGEYSGEAELPDEIEKDNARILGTGCPGNHAPGSSFPPMTGIDCDSRKCQWLRIYNEATWSYKAEAKHVYQAAAIYFRLKSEIAHFKNNPSNSFGWSSEPSPGMTITYWGSFKPKNRSTRNLSGCYDQCQGCGPVISNKDKVQKIHYEAGRRLTSYNLYGIFEVHLGGNHAPSGYPDSFQLHNIQR